MSAFLPGSVFIVVATGGGIGDTTVTRVATTPVTFGEDKDTGEAKWRAAADEIVRSIEVPTDGEDRKKNRSDLLSAISVATAEAGNYPGFDKHLIVGSDGYFESLGMSLEHDALEPAAAIERLDASGLAWDLSGWSSIVMCGQHAMGGKVDAIGRRGRVWPELLQQRNAPTPRVLTSCTALTGGVTP